MLRLPTVAFLIACSILSGLLIGSVDAEAIPAFTRQTKLGCGICHSPPPQLTPFGRRFLLSGFQYSSVKPKQPPLSGLVFANYVSTDKTPAPESADPHGNEEIKFELASIYASAPLTDTIGYYLSGDYDGIEEKAKLGTVDIRRVDNTKMWDRDLLYGVSVNNDPGVQDPWNTNLRRIWPYFAAGVEPRSQYRAALDGVLSRRVLGVGGYGFFQDSLYLEASIYGGLGEDTLDTIGHFRDEDRQLDNTAIYLRLAREYRLQGGSFTLGATYFDAEIEGPFHGPVDEFRDLAVNGLYQRAFRTADITISMNYLIEDIDSTESHQAGLAEGSSNRLNRFRFSAGYQYKKEFGVGVGYARTDWAQDALYFNLQQEEPDTEEFRIDLYWNALYGRVPKSYRWVRTRVGLQYVHFDRFHGASRNYDGLGRDASDNNSLSAYWILVF